MSLTPVGHNALGRSAFLIHGNNAVNNASKSCIILGPTIRNQIANGGDTTLILLWPQATADRCHGPTSSLGAYQFGRAASRRI